MSNFLSIEEAIEKSGIKPQDFEKNYVETGIISIQVNDGIKQIELSEFSHNKKLIHITQNTNWSLN